VDNPLVQPDPGLFIWTILTFLVLLWLLKRFAWGPLMEALDRREQVIAGAVEDARRAKDELERVKSDAAKLLTEARQEAGGIVTRARADADRFREELRQKAVTEADALVQNAEKRIQQETSRAVQQLRQEAVELSVAIAGKLLHRNISREDNERFLQDVVKQLENTPQ
jgi:F-type H+-transporting ATPase subunit b